MFPDNWVGQMGPTCSSGTTLGGGRNLSCLGLSVYPLAELKDKINVMLNYRKIKLYLIVTL